MREKKDGKQGAGKTGKGKKKCFNKGAISKVW